ncbi:MAG TPA: sigma-70 family RNA polymerase sigma factor [Phototrophicaceae bacterium]|nr:sigma-70 family RNA polymerase sigma factor [Phototrophicaceae bacterium]
MSRWEPMLERVAHERYPRLVAHAMLLVRSRVEAEDLVQEALVSTFTGKARFASLAEAEQYVRRAIVSRFMDSARKRGRERAAYERFAARPAVVRDIADGGLPGEVEAALAGLPPQERACVVLRHVEDLSVRDTAALLRLSEGAVKRYTSDGVAALGAALGTTVDESPLVTVTTKKMTAKEVRRGA